jgi:hypothetical protein
MLSLNNAWSHDHWVRWLLMQACKRSGGDRHVAMDLDYRPPVVVALRQGEKL